MATPQRKKASPWGISPFCDTKRAYEMWDKKGGEEKKKQVNEERKKKGLPLI